MKKHKGKVVFKRGKFKVIDCEKCGFKHLWPFLSLGFIQKFYQKRYFQKGSAQLLIPKKEKKEFDWASLEYQDILDVLNKYIKSRGKVLDIGCGNGFFLKFMKDNGWEVLGLEPSIKASKYARRLGVPVVNKTLEEFNEKKWQGYFDAINCRNVLEHAVNPRQILAICKKLLDKTRGILSVNVPNDFNLFQITAQKILNNPYWYITIPEHINYFNFESISRLLERSGFRVVSRTTNFPMELFLLMGENYVENKKLGSACHKKRMRFDLNLPTSIRRRFYRAMADNGFGRDCIIFTKIKTKLYP